MKAQNTEERLTAETRRGEECPSTSSGRTAFLPVMLSLSKHLLILCSVLLISACGGGGGGGESSSTSPSSTITFSGSSSGYNVYMAQNTSQSSGSVIAIDVKVDNVSDIYGAAFDVDFDSSKMTYSSYSAGSFLESGGNSVTYQAALQSDTSGKLIVVASRQGAISGNSGSGTEFDVTSGGSISFSNSSLVDSSGNTISSASWSSGGTVTVQ